MYRSSVHATISSPLESATAEKLVDSGKKNDGSLGNNSNGHSFFPRILSSARYLQPLDCPGGRPEIGADENFRLLVVSCLAEQGCAETIGCWDTSRVTNMTEAFKRYDFNQPLDLWDTSSVTDMTEMFWASSFNQPLASWDVSSVTSMSSMFFAASSFNQPLNSWDTSSVTDMDSMLAASSFNQPLDSWDVSSATNMYAMFSSSSSFNQPLDSWDVSSVTDMGRMFEDASSFNQCLGAWEKKIDNSTYTWSMIYGSGCPFATKTTFSINEPWKCCLDPTNNNSAAPSNVATPAIMGNVIGGVFAIIAAVLIASL